MTRRQTPRPKRQRHPASPPFCPDVVKDETVIVPKGECTYTLNLDDAQVELLASGVCPADVAAKCWEMFAWKREHARNLARACPIIHNDA